MRRTAPRSLGDASDRSTVEALVFFCRAARIVFLVGLAAIFAGAGPARGQSGTATDPVTTDRLTMVMVDFPPFTYMDNGVPRGTVYERFRTVAERAGFQLDARLVPAKRMVQDIIAGTAQVSVSINSFPEWQDAIVSAPSPFDFLVVAAYSRGDIKIKVIDDLRGVALIFRLGYSYGGIRATLTDIAVGNTVVAEVNSAEQGLRLLAARRGDVFIEYRNNASPVIPAVSLAGLQSITLRATPIFINVSRQLLDAVAIAARLEKTFGDLVKTGVLSPVAPPTM